MWLQTDRAQYPFHNENWCRLKGDSSLGCLTVPSCGEKNRARLQIKWTDHYYYFLILTSVPGGPGGPGSPWRERRDVTKGKGAK